MGIDFTVFKGSSTGEIVETKGHRDIEPTEVIVKISHCGVCGTDEHYRHADQGLGHEGVGTIVEVGSQVHSLSDFRVGDRVGTSYFHKFCGYCKYCLRGQQTMCTDPQAYSVHNLDQGAFSTAMACDISALWKIPEGLSSEDAGPLMCGGATVWDPLYNGGLQSGDRVGIVGIGGLGHLAIQFASKMGFESVVFSSTESKRAEAMAFGASEFHATKNPDDLAKIEKLDMLLVTAASNPDMRLYIPLLAHGAKLYPLTISMESMSLSPLDLIMPSISVVGSGTAPVASLQAMLSFAAKHKVKPQIEKFPMTQKGVTEAMTKLREGKMRYRGVVIVPGN